MGRLNPESSCTALQLRPPKKLTAAQHGYCARGVSTLSRSRLSALAGHDCAQGCCARKLRSQEAYKGYVHA
jgi:hypothetical protein